jgi:ethanolaminephosphotransferase
MILILDVLQPLHDLFTLFLMTQSRATNIPLFLLLELQFHVLGWLELLPLELTLTSLLFQYASFFAFGGSNAISSVDLSNAYNGIAGYNVIAVGILTFCGNWAGSLWWTSATALLLSRHRRQGQWKLWGRHTATLTTFVSSSVLFVMLACTALRTHLFIWTVFSPKYLYSMAWSMGQHICISIGLGSLLFWVGTW